MEIKSLRRKENYPKKNVGVDTGWRTLGSQGVSWGLTGGQGCAGQRVTVSLSPSEGTEEQQRLT